MTKENTLKYTISLILLLSFIIINISYSANILNVQFPQMFSEVYSEDLFPSEDTSYNSKVSIIVLQDALVCHQIICVRTIMPQRFVGHNNDSYKSMYLPNYLLNYVFNMQHLCRIKSVAVSIKGRLSVIALSLGGNSPPIITL